MFIPPPPPPVTSYLRGHKIPLGRFHSTVLPDIDFETFSQAGYVWNPETGKWVGPPGAAKGKKGLPVVGAAVYSEHDTTEVLLCAYNLKDGSGTKRWQPGAPLPVDLFQYLLTFDVHATPSYDQAGIIEAHNAMFELRHIINVLEKKHGWPHLELSQFRCSAAKARANGLPGGLDPLSKALFLAGKDPRGGELIERFSIPQTPSKKNGYIFRVTQEMDPVGFEEFAQYNDQDIVAESEASARVPDLNPFELRYWLADLAINYRGVGCDTEAVDNCIAILEQALAKYNPEIEAITGGFVKSASQVERIKGWLLEEYGIDTQGELDDGTIDGLLETDIPQEVRQALKIRKLVGSASAKKVYAMKRQVTKGGNLCDMTTYHGARTGRDNGGSSAKGGRSRGRQEAEGGVQPLNMPKAGPKLRWCGKTGRPYAQDKKSCVHCGDIACFAFGRKSDWEPDAVDFVLETIATRELEIVEYFFSDALLCVSGCARGMFIARKGKKLIGVDYSAIEAVVAAVLSGEQWRIDSFRNKRDIYLASAAEITGLTYEYYIQWAKDNGKKHDDRANIGKVAELALGFGGGLGSWKNFDDSGRFLEDEISELIKKWRKKSPNIVEMWGGQKRYGRPELFGLEGMAILSIQNPGQEYAYKGITYFVDHDVLYCRLYSGRCLAYHQPRLIAQNNPKKAWLIGTPEITFMGYNTNTNYGAVGWVRMSTYGARLFENVVQATARDIMAHAVVNLEDTGEFDVVLRVHDEIVTEVDEGSKTVADQLAIMLDLPTWAKGWPINAAGWDAPRKRYMKD